MITYSELCAVVNARKRAGKLSRGDYVQAITSVGYTDDTPENWKAFDERMKAEPELRLDILRALP